MGGGIITTAAKSASLGAFRPPIVDEAARRAARHQVAAIQSAVPSVDSALSFTSVPSDKVHGASSSVPSWPAWEIHDWEFAGVEEEEAASVDPSPRMVFAPLPTLEEAKEATADLKEAMEKVYFQPNYAPNSQKGCQVSVPGGNSAISSVPKHVTQMFSLLHGSSEAQSVVASLAADKNVWEAVMKNDVVMQFCKNPPPIVTAEANKFPEESSSSKEETTVGSMFADMLNSFKVRVLEMVGNISDMIQDFFGNTARRSVEEAYTEMAIGGSFVALAVAVIMMILLKRG